MQTNQTKVREGVKCPCTWKWWRRSLVLLLVVGWGKLHLWESSAGSPQPDLCSGYCRTTCTTHNNCHKRGVEEKKRCKARCKTSVNLNWFIIIWRKWEGKTCGCMSESEKWTIEVVVDTKWVWNRLWLIKLKQTNGSKTKLFVHSSRFTDSMQY